MTVQETIEQKIADGLSPSGLEVINESHMHNVPPGSESHFKVVVICDEFEGQRLIMRHQRINAILADELAGPVHALAMQTLTTDEWKQKGGQTLPSPPCMGGNRH